MLAPLKPPHREVWTKSLSKRDDGRAKLNPVVRRDERNMETFMPRRLCETQRVEARLFGARLTNRYQGEPAPGGFTAAILFADLFAVLAQRSTSKPSASQ